MKVTELSSWTSSQAKLGRGFLLSGSIRSELMSASNMKWCRRVEDLQQLPNEYSAGDQSEKDGGTQEMRW